MLIVVIDANVLIQCKPFHELPWSELGDELRVVIPFACIREIDRHKGDGNTRRANRARLASSMFSKTLESTLDRHPIAGQASRTWELGSGRLFEHASLDKNASDDQLVAEGLALASETEQPVLVLSGDTILRLKARTTGLQF